MHMYVVARGATMWLDRWINDLQSKYMPFRYKPDEPAGALQLTVRPVQLLEIIFPEEHYRQVLSWVTPYDDRKSKMQFIMRKLLGADKITEEVPPSQDIYNNFKGCRWVSVMGIGTKKDKRGANGIEKI